MGVHEIRSVAQWPPRLQANQAILSPGVNGRIHEHNGWTDSHHMDPDSNRNKIRGIRWLDWAVALAIGTSLLCHLLIKCAHSRLTYDSLVTILLVSDKSFWNMLHAVVNGLEVNPPLFYTFGWVWEKAFGHSEVAM